VACAAAIAGWVATGSELISYGGLQIAFAFFYSVFQGYAPDTDLDNVRNRVVGILFGLIVTAVVFYYIWPEHAVDRLRDALRQALRQLSQLLRTDGGKPEPEALVAKVSMELAQAQRQAELASFESEELGATDQASKNELEDVLAHAQEIFASAKSLVQGNERRDQTRTALLSEITVEIQRLN